MRRDSLRRIQSWPAFVAVGKLNCRKNRHIQVTGPFSGGWCALTLAWSIWTRSLAGFNPRGCIRCSLCSCAVWCRPTSSPATAVHRVTRQPAAGVAYAAGGLRAACRLHDGWKRFRLVYKPARSQSSRSSAPRHLLLREGPSLRSWTWGRHRRLCAPCTLRNRRCDTRWGS
jgi:hypothetical protein